MQVQLRSIVLLCLLLPAMVAAEESERMVTVYGFEHGSQVPKRHSNCRYQVQVGAFRKKDNALQYERFLRERVGASVHVLSPKNENGYYHVLIGPLSAEEMVQISRQLLNKMPVKPITPLAKKDAKEEERKKIKAEAEQVSSELANIKTLLNQERDQQKLADLENQQNTLKTKMNELVQQVIKRITVPSQAG